MHQNDGGENLRMLELRVITNLLFTFSNITFLHETVFLLE